MDNFQKDIFFLLIKNNQIIFTLLNKKNQIIFKKELFAKRSAQDKNFDLLNKFLEQNLIYIEKKFKHFIKDINLIIDLDESISVNVSTINSFTYSSNLSEDTLINLLNLKKDVMKNFISYDLLHMTINKYIINGKEFSKIPENDPVGNMFLEVNFDMINGYIIQDLKTLLAKYEILVKNVSNFKYVNFFNNSNSDNIFELTNKLNNGFNHNQIHFKKNEVRENGIFAKFFNLFN